MPMESHPGRGWPPGARAAAFGAALLTAAAAPAAAQTCTTANTTTAYVVALDQHIWYNRLGAHDPAAMIFALRQDVVSTTPGDTALKPGQVRLRPGKRPRPLVLRVHENGCLNVHFQNLLDPDPGRDQPWTRAASVHVFGFQVRTSITDDGSNVRTNPNSLAVNPGDSRSYYLRAPKEGTYLMYSTGVTTGNEADGGSLSRGLFGAVNVEPVGSTWYRSQVTRQDLLDAQRTDAFGFRIYTPGTHPVLDYAATYASGPLAGRPILAIRDASGVLQHGDLTAIVVTPALTRLEAETLGYAWTAEEAAEAAAAEPAAAAGTVDAEAPVGEEEVRPIGDLTIVRKEASFREMTVIFHDEAGLVQAFDDVFENDTFSHTLHSGRDAFAINYGTAAIGAEVLANRFGVGPMANCNDCKYEEFFLSSWAVGDPAMVVDVPADFDGNGDGEPDPGNKATVAYFPDDPSNVYHSYLNDRLKIRNLHAGPKEHHIFHLHAHQWLHTPDSKTSSYLDSQAIGPGGGYTYEIFHGGSGNLNRTPGDAIFHCHFYPHFAQGMWALWRVHDVFEAGTTLDGNGRPAAGSRALPDAEIAAGTPIPAVVPIPSVALAPMPSSNNPGFPFYIPGVAGHRPPPPPRDFASDGAGGYIDGGLHRHVVTGGVAVAPPLNRFDFSKDDVTILGTLLPETGTAAEVAAMNFHAAASHGTWRFDQAGTISNASFLTNGRPAAPGAPFADPCPAGALVRAYRAASIQITARYNKAGWFFPQHRMFSLWGDVADFVNHARAPEPLFFRANAGECIDYHLVNLVPKEYQMDDFQVQSPTDIIGQHIHLVKFDVTASDGAANGFNYEDGALSPEDVVLRIAAIRLAYGCDDGSPPAPDGTWPCLVAEPHPVLGVLGAQQNVQRWYADQQNASGLRTVFTHDHFGPSTHQQTGLYAGLVVEPASSTWRHPDTGVIFGSRSDGGPTSWRADILTADPASSFREFNLQIADFALAYRDSVGLVWTPQHARLAINPPAKNEPGLPYLVERADRCPTEDASVYLPLPCPELVSAADPGTMLVNYRNEPLALRSRNPASNTQAAGDPGDLGLAFSSQITRSAPYLSGHPWYPALTPGLAPNDPYTPLLRAIEDDSVVINLLVGAHEESHNFSLQGLEWRFEPKDPASGWRAGQGMGISEHFEIELPPLFNLSGDPTDYLYQAGSATDDLWNGIWGIIRSYRAPATGATPEQQALVKTGEVPDAPPLPLPSNPDGATAVSLAVAEADAAALRAPAAKAADPLDRFVGLTKSSAEALTEAELATAPKPLLGPDGGYGNVTQVWDPITGTYSTVTPALPAAGFAEADPAVTGTGYPAMPTSVGGGFAGMCPRAAPVRQFDVSAVSARTALPGGKLVYNSRTANGGPLTDTSAILYVYTADLSLVNGVWTLNAGVPVEPLVLRAAAGDCVVMRLRNRLTVPLIDPDGFNTLPMVVDSFNANQVRPSPYVGLNPQLVAYDPLHSDAAEVGNNPRTVVAPGALRDFQWYAGQVILDRTINALRAFPVEYGSSALTSPDRIQHPNKGAIAALVVEPYGSAWVTDAASRNQATVYRASDGVRMFREFVTQYQDDINLRFGGKADLPSDEGECSSASTPQKFADCFAQGGSSVSSFAAGQAVPNTAEAEDSEDSGQKAFNYRTEPMWFRRGYAPDAPLTFTRKLPLANILNDSLGVPQTPQFPAYAGEHVRMRVVHSGGHARNHVFQVHGHVWQELPFSADSRWIASRPASEQKGGQDNLGPKSHFNFVLKDGAGGAFRIPGSYLYRDQPSFQFDGGLWGTLRVNRRRYCYTASGELVAPSYESTAQPVDALWCQFDVAAPATGSTGATLTPEP